MADASSVQSLYAMRDPKLDAVLARWSDSGGEAMPVLDTAASLGLEALLAQLVEQAGGPGDSRGCFGFIVLARRLLAAEIAFADVLEILQAPAFSDLNRIVGVLYACADPQLQQEALDLVVLRLAADTAHDAELAARLYLQLGHRSQHDDNNAAHAYSYAFNKIASSALHDLQAQCLLGLARCALRMEKFKDAIDNASLARQLFDKAGDTGQAELAAIIEAVGNLENGDPVAAAKVARPVVIKQRAGGVAPGSQDARVILKHCISAVARPAFEQALTGDVNAIASYETALALIGDTGYQYPDEATDRCVMGQALLRGDNPDKGQAQLERAVAIARERGTPAAVLKTLIPLCDWLVHTQNPQGETLSGEALALVGQLEDTAALPQILVMRGHALRHAGRLPEAIEHFARANELTFRIAFQVAWIGGLFEADRSAEALDAVAHLCQRMAEGDPQQIQADRAHVAFLITTLLPLGHPGLAQQLQQQLARCAPGTGDAATGVGSDLHAFTARASTTLSQAGAQLMAGEHAQVEAALLPLLAEADTHGATAIWLACAYTLGENALVKGEFTDALRYLESVQLKADTLQPGLRAAALNKIGTVYSTGLKRPEAALEYHARALAIQRELADWPGVVVTLIQGAQSCVVAGQLEQARRYADELAQLGPQYPPPDIEWVSYVPALVAAYHGDWDQAGPGFQAAIAELERKRVQFTTAQQQRTWCAQKAVIYGNAIEAAIIANAAEAAITYLELARNRYLVGVARARNPLPDGGTGLAPTALDDQGFISQASLAERLPPGGALVWCGGFPRGLGVVAAWREASEVVLRCRLFPEVTGQDLTDLYQGDIRRLMDAHEAGHSVEFALEMMQQGRNLDLGASGYWQTHGHHWQQSIAAVVDFVSDNLWPKLLQTIGQQVSQIALLPSVGCSELPLCAAAPDSWADGTPLGVSVAAGLEALVAASESRPESPQRLLQVENPTEDKALVCCSIEAQSARAVFAGKPRVLRGRRASQSRIAGALGEADVFHFMGHAYCDWSDPLDSGLMCALRKDESAVLTVRDLFALVGYVDTRLVVLSACQIGNVQAGDTQNDFINLPSALVAAGARSVIAPRWSVDDVATSMLLSSLFERWLAGGLPVLQALGEAKCWLRDAVTCDDVCRWLAGPQASQFNADRLQALKDRYAEQFDATDRPFSHVAHWGAFEMIGDPQPFGGANA